MQKKITTLVIDMYGVILKEPKGNFIPYTFSHFDKSEHERLRRQFEEERLFTKAGYGDISSHEFLSLLGYQDTEFHMRDYIENHLSFDSSKGLFLQGKSGVFFLSLKANYVQDSS